MWRTRRLMKDAVDSLTADVMVELRCWGMTGAWSWSLRFNRPSGSWHDNATANVTDLTCDNHIITSENWAIFNMTLQCRREMHTALSSGMSHRKAATSEQVQIASLWKALSPTGLTLLPSRGHLRGPRQVTRTAPSPESASQRKPWRAASIC